MEECIVIQTPRSPAFSLGAQRSAGHGAGAGCMPASWRSAAAAPLQGISDRRSCEAWHVNGALAADLPGPPAGPGLAPRQGGAHPRSSQQMPKRLCGWVPWAPRGQLHVCLSTWRECRWPGKWSPRGVASPSQCPLPTTLQACSGRTRHVATLLVSTAGLLHCEGRPCVESAVPWRLC